MEQLRLFDNRDYLIAAVLARLAMPPIDEFLTEEHTKSEDYPETLKESDGED